MAKYTILYSDYVKNGGAIPSSFALITDFETLFLARYGDREIGFETEDVFGLKLELRASLLMELYADRIKKYDSLLSEIGDATERSYTDESTDTANMGATRSTSAELPIDEETATPNVVAKTDAVTNGSTHTATHKEKSYRDANDLLMRLDYLNKKTNLLEQLLDAYEDLFMGVY